MPKMVDRICQKCGNVFMCREAYVKRGDGKFCSRLCNQKNNGDKNTSIANKLGEKNPRWKGGKEVRDSNHKKYVKEYKIKNAEKVVAQRKLQKAVKNNLITKLECFVCGEKNVEGHHPVYSMPLDVVWLCRKHHIRLHLEHKAHLATHTS